ncbi:hypothetical protein HU200_032598 [Digitaria exilis]|uniref:Uncharacterized protein n=1 Tax=Digitaria exilis TaxID=1010633 RepID=A0A835BKK3_9POAL|nr:hypothetical protein HU200_032598 [Digitaria exilis]
MPHAASEAATATIADYIAMSSSSIRTFPSQAEQETVAETKMNNYQELYQRYANSAFLTSNSTATTKNGMAAN